MTLRTDLLPPGSSAAYAGGMVEITYPDGRSWSAPAAAKLSCSAMAKYQMLRNEGVPSSKACELAGITTSTANLWARAGWIIEPRVRQPKRLREEAG